MDDLHKNQAEFARVAKEIDPTKTPDEELKELQGCIRRRTNCWRRFTRRSIR